MRRSKRLDIALILLLCLMGQVHGNDSSSPAGTWYLSADGQRLALSIQDHGGNTWGGSIQVEGTPGMSEVINHLEWYPGTRRIVIRTYTATGLWRWHRGHIVEGVIKGRSSDPDTSPMQPAVSGFTRHFTGWNAHHIDQQLTPRTFDLQISGEYLARLRIDESAPGSGLHVGQMKVYASQSQGAFDEALQYDIHVSHWDGTLLQFHRGTTDDWQAFSGSVDGRSISGQYFQSGSPLLQQWQGWRAEVLGRGTGSGETASTLSAWQARLRRQLELLTMARAPMASSMTVNTLQANLAPIASAAMHPRRDDNPDQWPRAYRMDELEFEFDLPNPYGSGALTRRAHGYLARPYSSLDGKRPAVVVLNGHGGSAYAMMNPDHPDYWYGDAFARRGFVVLALDVSHRDYGDDPDNGNIAHPPIAAEGFSSDWEEDGERAWTAMRAIDYLLGLPDVDPDQIIVAGLSMGGEVAGIVGAMDTRVWATITSGYSPDLNVIRHRANHPCWQWTWADLTEYVEMSDYQALVAPRLLLVQTGAIDPVFSHFQPPFASDKQVVHRASSAHNVLAGLSIHHLHDGGHVFRVGDITVDGVPAAGLSVPTLSGPTVPWDLDWQTDGQTNPLGMTLFDLLDWADESMERIFSDGFDSAGADANASHSSAFVGA